MAAHPYSAGCISLVTLLLCVVFGVATPVTRAAGSSVLDQVPLIDGHNDIAESIRRILLNQIEDFNFDTDLSQLPEWSNLHTDLPKLREGKVGGQFWSAYVGCSSQYKDAVTQTLEQIDLIKRFIQKYPKDLVLATSSQEIWQAFNKKQIASLIGVEGGHSIDSSLGVLRMLYDLGTRYLTLTHSCNTPWADSSTSEQSPVHNGLTEFGKLVIKEMNRLGMLVDLAHVSLQTMSSVLDVSRAPVIFSHSSARALCDNPRNIPDEILVRLAENRGVAMVNFYTAFLECDPNAKVTIDTLVNHINHIRNIAGVDHVGIGADYNGVGSVPIGLENVSKYPALFDRLANNKTGEPSWSEEDLKKLAGLNLIRAFSDAEKAAEELQLEEQVDEEWISVRELGDNTACKTDLRP